MAQSRSLLLLLLLVGCRARPYEEVFVDLDAGVRAEAAPDASSARVLRVSVAAIQSPTGTFGGYSKLLKVLSGDLGVEVTLVQRRSYRETNELLTSGRIDVAFVCTGGLFDLRRSGVAVDVLAVPVVRGTTTYQSLIIVPASSSARRLEDLAGRRFAFTDELSLSGYAWPTYAVRSLGLEPLRFFASSYFTHSHDRAVEAVARGFVDGAAVDSNIFEDMVAANPALAEQVRVVARSDPFGIPPVVALESLDAATRAKVRASLLSLHTRPAGTALLKELSVERFVEPPPGLYDTAFVILEGARK